LAEVAIPALEQLGVWVEAHSLSSAVDQRAGRVGIRREFLQSLLLVGRVRFVSVALLVLFGGVWVVRSAWRSWTLLAAAVVVAAWP
jgi:hypothetical protein